MHARPLRILTVLAALALLTPAIMAGLSSNTHAAAMKNPIHDPLPGDGDAVEPAATGTFSQVQGFATKSGYRLVFAWSAITQVAGYAEWGYAPDALDNIARPMGDAVDTAGIAMVDVDRADVTAHDAVHFRVRDALSGEVSAVGSFPLGNAWTSDASDGVYEIDAVLQLDSQALPDGIPFDQGVQDLARGIDVLAERIWDATDGYVRVGNVIVTDTNLNYPVNQPNGPGVCPVQGTASGMETTHTLADFLIQTTIPFDSHTYGASPPVIDDECTAFYLGRLGQLVVPWGISQDADLHLGAVMAHELGHYAFGLSDLYPGPFSTGDCWVGVSGEPDNSAGRWDITMMHNEFGWDGDRWVGSELDRGDAHTPCDLGNGEPSWPLLVQHYPAIPEEGRLGNHLPDHGDSAYDQARDNPDGGALDVFILDHEPATSTLVHFIESAGDGAGGGGGGVPEAAITAPEDGTTVRPEALDVVGTVNRDGGTADAAPSAGLSADPDRGDAPLNVTFTLAADDDGAITEWSLVFGDGADAAGGSGAPPATVNHTYGDNGTYDAALTVTDDAGASTTATVEVFVGAVGDAVRIGTDPTGDVMTGGCGTDAVACDRAWVADAADGLDLTAAYVMEVNDSLRFLFEVADADAFFNDPSGDPAAGDPSHVVSYQLAVEFQTTPATQYAVQIDRNVGSQGLNASVGKFFGAPGLGVTATSTVNSTPTVDAAANTFAVTVSKSQFPELAVLSTLEGLDASTAFLQEGAASRLVVTMDGGLQTVENDRYTVGQNLALPALGTNGAQPLQSPSSVPADPHITDPSGDVTLAGLPVSHMDVEAAWFHSDADFMYAGLKVADIPADANTTGQVAYKLGFVPDWSTSWGQPADATFIELRLQAILRLDDTSNPGAHSFTLQNNYEDATGGWVGDIADLPYSTVDPDTDIIWFVVPRDLLNDPQTDDALTDLYADVNAHGFIVVFGGSSTGDTATTTANFAFSGAAVPLAANAGGPYSGAPDEAIAITGTATGGEPPYACQWSGENATFDDASACATNVTFAHQGVHAIDVNVTDSAGNHSIASAMVTVEERERVEVYLDDEAEPRDVVFVDTDDTQPEADWVATVDLSDLVTASGEHNITAQWIGTDGDVLDAATVTVLVSEATVEVTSPGPGGDVDLPALFEGEYSTTGGDANDETGGAAPADAMPPAVEEWATDPFVQDTLASPAFRALGDALRGEPGYLGVVPDPKDGGVVLALFEGSAPHGGPTSLAAGTPVRYVENVSPEPLLRRASGNADAIPMDAFRDMSPQERDAWFSHRDPQGPHAPGPEEGAGPGGPIRMNFPGGTFICTASYLTEDNATGTYYLATAGHCLMGAEGDSATRPDLRANWVEVCVFTCASNTFGAGKYIRLTPDADTGYHPVAYAKHEGLGLDFGLIEIPEHLNDYLRAYMWLWGGPTGFQRPLIGDGLVHYGHGVPIGSAYPTQGRMGVNIDADKDLGILAAGWVMGGDSGSAVGTAWPRADAMVVGDGASGAITHSVVEIGLPIFWGTDFEKGLDFAEAALGFRPALVTEDAVIRPPGDTAPPLGASITAPGDGATVDLGDVTTLTVEGAATFPPNVQPGVAEVAYYLHRSDCGGDDQLWMDRVNSGPDGGDGCGSLAGPVGPVWESVIGEVANVHPADPAPGSTVYLDGSRAVESTIWVSGYRGTADNPQPVPTVISDFEVRLTVDGQLIGRQRLTDEILVDDPSPVNFSFPATVPAIPAGSDLEFSFIVHQADGPVFIHFGGDHASDLRLPVGTTDNAVQVSLDDATFNASSLLPVQPGATWESWTAPWNLTTAATGQHTIHARALQDGQPQSAPVDSVTVELVAGDPDADFAWEVTDLTVNLTDQSTPFEGTIVSREWSLGDGATATGTTVEHTYALTGSYTVTLTVTDDAGRTDTATAEVHVGKLPLQLRVLNATGATALDWTTVAAPHHGDVGAWTYTWDALPVPQGEYALQTRLLKDGVVVTAAQQDFVVPNLAPAPVPSDAAPVVDEQATLNLAVSATDPNGDAIDSVGAEVLPAGATFTDNGDGTGVLTWTPAYTDAGTHDVVLAATDADGATGNTVVTITVVDVNAPPVFDAIGDQVVPVNQTLLMTVSATDVDGDALTYAATGLPENATFDGATGVLTWATSSTDEGVVYDVVFTVTDGVATNTMTVGIGAGENEAPEVFLNVPKRVDVGFSRAFGAQAKDPEAHARLVKFEWDFDASDGFQVEAEGNVVTHKFHALGVHTVTVRATDADGFRTVVQRNVMVDDHVVVRAGMPGAASQRFDGAYVFDRPLDAVSDIVVAVEAVDDTGAPVAESVVHVTVRHEETGTSAVSRDYGDHNVTGGEGNVTLQPFAGDAAWPPGEYTVTALLEASSRPGGVDDTEYALAKLRFVVE